MIQGLKKNAFARSSAVLFAGSMVANILNYVFHLVVGRMVSVQVYGEVESLISLMNIISVPAMTLTMVATKYAAQCKAVDDKNGSYKIIEYMNKRVFKYGIPVLLITFFATPYISSFLNIESNVPLVIIWISMFFSFLLAINNGILNGWQKFKDVSVSGIWGVVVKLVSVIIFVKIGFQLNGLISSFLLSIIAAYIASNVTLRFILKDRRMDGSSCETKVDFKLIKKYILPVFVGTLAMNIFGNIDMVIAKHNLDAIVAGQYGALTIVSKIIFFATGVIGSVLFSMSAEDHHKQNNSLHILKNASYLMIFMCLSAIAIYFAFPGLIMSVLFGNKYVNVLGYLGQFAIMVSLFSFVNLFFSYLMSISRTNISYMLLAISAILLIVLLFFGTSIYAIITIMIVAQIVAILSSLFLVFYSQNLKV